MELAGALGAEAELEVSKTGGRQNFGWGSGRVHAPKLKSCAEDLYAIF